MLNLHSEKSEIPNPKSQIDLYSPFTTRMVPAPSAGFTMSKAAPDSSRACSPVRIPVGKALGIWFSPNQIPPHYPESSARFRSRISPGQLNQIGLAVLGDIIQGFLQNPVNHRFQRGGNVVFLNIDLLVSIRMPA